MKIKKMFYFTILFLGVFAFGYSVGRLRPALNSSNNSAIKLYNQYKVIKVDENCPIKANKNKTGGTYHVPGGQFYDRTKNPDECFKTETEAVQAGFKKSSR